MLTLKPGNEGPGFAPPVAVEVLARYGGRRARNFIVCLLSSQACVATHTHDRKTVAVAATDIVDAVELEGINESTFEGDVWVTAPDPSQATRPVFEELAGQRFKACGNVTKSFGLAYAPGRQGVSGFDHECDGIRDVLGQLGR